MTSPIVTTYQLVASNGRPIRKATKVTFADGREVRFTERLSKREAIRQATAAPCSHPNPSAWHAYDGTLCLACTVCGDVLQGGVTI